MSDSWYCVKISRVGAQSALEVTDSISAAWQAECQKAKADNIASAGNVGGWEGTRASPCWGTQGDVQW